METAEIHTALSVVIDLTAQFAISPCAAGVSPPFLPSHAVTRTNTLSRVIYTPRIPRDA